jgi:hypothetical protein
MTFFDFLIPLVAAYFLVAVFVPRIRPRWGVRVRRSVIVLKPKFGAVSCIGAFIIISTFFIPTFWPHSDFKVAGGTFVTGGILFFIGMTIDSIRGRTEYRRK